MGKDIREIDKNMKENISVDNNGCKWFDLNNEYLLGSAFHNNFERLDKDRNISENVNELKKHPAGMSIEFKTNSQYIKIKAQLVGAAYMSHMPATSTIGFDIYVLDKKGKWCFLAVTKINKSEYEVDLLKGLDGKEHTYKLYFPLYQGLISAYIGVEENKNFEFIKNNMKKIVVYGTSISQGGCSSRPGMAYPAILGRMTGYDVINLGFSGSCKCEKDYVEIFNNIEKDYLILEPEANSPSIEHMKTNLGYILDHLENKDKYKIILISYFDCASGMVQSYFNGARKKFFELENSFEGVQVVDGRKLLKELHYDGSVDGAHLSDLGFYVVAKKLAKLINEDQKKNK